MEKHPFIRLEETIAGVFKKEREQADAMRRDAHRLGANVAIARVMSGVGTALLSTSQDFAGTKPEFLELACESMKTIGHWLTFAADTKRNMGSLNPIWALDQLQPNLKRVLNEFRSRLM